MSNYTLNYTGQQINSILSSLENKIQDAPSNGKKYVRRGKQWTELQQFGQTLRFRYSYANGLNEIIDFSVHLPFTVTNMLQNVTNSNQASTIEEGQSYTATLTVQPGCVMSSVIITMAGIDITSSAYSDNTINIQSATGDIVITAVAVEIMPTGYTQVEYLEGTGSQYIDTGINPTNFHGTIETRFMYTQLIHRSNIWGCYTPRFYLAQQDDLGLLFFIANGVNGQTSCIPSTTSAETAMCTIDSTGLSGNVLYNGVVTTSTGSNNTYTENIFLYARNEGGSPTNYFYGRIYQFTMTDSSAGVVANYIPCYRKSDGKPGMYDTVSRTFKTNLGSGSDFVLGQPTGETYTITNNLVHVTNSNSLTSVAKNDPYIATLTPDESYSISSVGITMNSVDITQSVYSNNQINILSVTGNVTINATAAQALPTAYQKVQYLKSSGAQYIDTGVSLNSTNLEMDTTLQYLAQPSGTNVAVGIRGSSLYGYLVFAGSMSNTMYAIGSSDNISYGTFNTNSHNYRLLFNNGTITSYMDGVAGQTKSYSSSDIDTSLTLYLFAGHGTSGVKYPSTIKVYDFKIAVNGTITCNLIPCYRKSDNKPGMYDMVSGAFKTNLGTGTDFELGPNVN